MRSTFLASSRWLGSFVLLALLDGCAGNGEGLDQNGRPTTGGNGNTPLTATFSSIQTNVFTPICTKCHSGATAPLGLRLDAGNSYALLVGVASGEVPSLQRIKAGDPNSSYLIQKISGTAAIGARMPLDGPPYLPQSTIDIIRQWVTLGAPMSSDLGTIVSQVKTTGLQVTTSAPMDGGVVNSSVSQLVVGFDREIDATLANAGTVTLERMDDGASLATTQSVPLANPTTLLINLPQPLTDGSYRLILRGAGGTALAGLDTLPLNSPGGRVPGVDTAIQFTVKVQQ